MEQKWPQTLWIVRHGQSAGNVAREAADAANLPLIDIATRDMDTPLSSLGQEQARTLGQWIGQLPPQQQPQHVLCSPYVRAHDTARLLLDESGLGKTLRAVADERLREKEFGILDRLTRRGIDAKYPELGEQRRHVGKFYFRPPGGESWCDVVLRLRSVLDTLTRDYRAERVLVVSHQVVVSCLRYLLERMDEAQILDIDRQADVPNCSVTSYEFDPTQGRRGKLVLRLLSFTAPLREAGTSVTAAPDVPAAPKP